MSRKKAIVWVAVFLFLIVSPSFLYALFGKYVDTENHENRTSAAKPVLTAGTLWKFPKEYEAYYNDTHPFRNQLIKINKGIEFYLLKESSSKVLIGENGWLFYTDPADGNPVEQSLGYWNYSDEQLKAIADNLVRCQETCERQGMEFVVLIAPNKETIYLDEIPDYYKQKNPETSAMQLVSYLRQNTDVRVVYPREELEKFRDANPDVLLYQQLDTHWNNAGAYIAASCLAEELGLTMPQLEDITYQPTYSDSGDLTKMLNIKVEGGNTDYKLKDYSKRQTESVKKDTKTKEFLYHTEGADKRRVFIWKDSYGDKLAPYLASQFEESYSIRSTYATPQQIIDFGADVLVLETVERYLDALGEFTVPEVKR